MKLDKYVIYMGDFNGSTLYGGVDVCFNHNPPTYKDIRDMEKEIKNKFDLRQCLILMWQDITPEEE